LSVWVDLQQNTYDFESDLRHMVLQKPCGDVRLALLMGMIKVIDERSRGKSLKFYSCGNKKTGSLTCLRLHLSELTRKQNSTRVACSLLLYTTQSEDLPIKSAIRLSKNVPRREDIDLGPFQIKRYMTCEISNMNGQRSDDIFIFLTEIFPTLLRKN